MKNLIFLTLICLSLGVIATQAAPTNASRFGFYWKNETLPYDTEFSYFYDVAAYPDGIFADCDPHSFVYVTAQNKHIGYGATTYGVELVLTYGFGANNFQSIKRVWVFSHDDDRFFDPWIDSDADGEDYWEMSTLEANGYFTTAQDTDGDSLQFLRVQQQTIFVSETISPATSTWENRFYFFNFVTDTWDMKMKNSFTIPASRQAVRNATYEQGSGIWAGILETDGDEIGPPDYGRPPVRKVVYRNRWIRVVDDGVTNTPDLTLENNGWSIPDPASYHLFYLSEPVLSEYGAGTESVIDTCSQVYLPMLTKPNVPFPTNLQDDFSTNSLPSYSVMGTAVWQSNSLNVWLGNGGASDNRIYLPGTFVNNATITGRVYVPDSNVGSYDTVAVALRGNGIEYWATIAYGHGLVEQNNVSIIRNDVWGDLYPVAITPGWYTIKLFADQNNQVLQMKAWKVGTVEPGWQVSRTLDGGWAPQGVGFRHYGLGTQVDDLSFAQQ